jgi:hypothetical protein
MKNILPDFHDTQIEKKNAWIAFVREELEELDFHVYDTSKRPYLSRVVIDSMEPIYTVSDIGNCLSCWEDWTLADVIFKFGFQYDMSVELRIRVLEELSKIKEWNSDCIRYLEIINNDQY